MAITVQDILRDIGSQLAYMESSGVEYYPVSESVVELLNSSPVTERMDPSAVVPSLPDAAPEPEDRAPEVEPGAASAHGESLAGLAQDIAVCMACSLSANRIMPVPGRGGGRVRLLIVGDWLMAGKGTRLPDTCVFGIEQDRMLGRMLEAIKLPKDEVFVTNLIKCAIPAGVQPQADHVSACSSYLQKQVLFLRPEMILAMGMVPARVMLNRSGALARLRGRFHSYTATDGSKIPLVATYHPTFLMQNEGMKKATWEDLKLVARQLKLQIG